MKDTGRKHEQQKIKNTEERQKYLRFGAMIATSMVIMYALTYINTYQLSHVMWSETRLFMTLLMGSTMAVVMLGFMMGMYKNKKINAGIIAGSVLLFTLGTFLVRSQSTVQDSSYMSAMVPHHSIAILTSENSDIEDVRVCELAIEIIKAQRREIAEMQWLINDISKNGKALTQAEARQREVPEFDGTASKDC